MTLNKAVMKELRRLNLQTRVYVRLCMLGVSLAVLPRKLNEPLDEEETDIILKALLGLGLGAITTSIGALS